MSAADLTPQAPPGGQVIERYAASGFRVSGVIYRSPVLVFPDHTLVWRVAGAAAVTEESLAPVIEHGGVRILLIGLGRAGGRIAAALRSSLRAAGIAVEPMQTAAACRTFNVLVAEERAVAAALIPPS